MRNGRCHNNKSRERKNATTAYFLINPSYCRFSMAYESDGGPPMIDILPAHANVQDQEANKKRLMRDNKVVCEVLGN